MKHYNNSLSERASRILNLKGESMPEEVEGPVLVIPIFPISRFVKRATRATTGSGTVFTTPSDKDFYITTATLSYEADATCDTTSINLTCVQDTATVYLIEFAKLATTASRDTITLEFPAPIKVDKGTNILMTCTFTAGNIRFCAQITGFTEEVTKS